MRVKRVEGSFAELQARAMGLLRLREIAVDDDDHGLVKHTGGAGVRGSIWTIGGELACSLVALGVAEINHGYLRLTQEPELARLRAAIRRHEREITSAGHVLVLPGYRGRAQRKHVADLRLWALAAVTTQERKPEASA